MNHSWSRFSFFVLFVSFSTFAEPVIIEKLAASVNNQIVLLSDVTRFRKNIALRSQLDPLFATSKMNKKDPSDKEIIDFLVEESLISQEFPLTDEEVEQEINTIQANNRINREQLKQAIGAQGFSFKDYFELIRIGASKRNLLDREIRTKVSITDDDVKNYFISKYQKSVGTSYTYKVRWIYSSSQKPIDIALSEIKLKKSSFSEAAKKYSEDATSAASGGLLGELSENQLSPLIKKHIKQVKLGEVSPVLGNVKTGFLIFMVENRFDSIDAGLKQHADDIRNILTNQEFSKQIGFWIERKKQSAFVRVNP